MAHVYEKQTKDMIDFPAYTLCFLNIAMNKLESYGLIDGKPSTTGIEPPNVLLIPVVSRNFSYCQDGIDLITKTLKRRGFSFEVDNYKVVTLEAKDGKGEEKGYSYKLKLKKL